MTTFRLTPTNNEQKQHVDMKRSKKNLDSTNSIDMNQDNKPKRKRISPEQFSLLSELFQQTDTPSHELREKLANKLNMTNREVQVWFQNRRAKVNRSRLQEDSSNIVTTTITTDVTDRKVKFNYWSTHTPNSSNNSSLTNSPCLLSSNHELPVFHPDLTPIDILASAAAYVQQWDENEQQRKRQKALEEEGPPKKKKSWRPWL